jgi:hypothetical protein
MASDFVSSIVTDPKNVPDVTRLYGYLGASSEEDHERLYLNPDLTHYVEVPTQAILYRMTVPADQDPHGAVCLWVKKYATLIYKMSPAANALAHYFAGTIHAGTAGAAAAPAPGAATCGGFTYMDPRQRTMAERCETLYGCHTPRMFAPDMDPRQSTMAERCETLYGCHTPRMFAPEAMQAFCGGFTYMDPRQSTMAERCETLYGCHTPRM